MIRKFIVSFFLLISPFSRGFAMTGPEDRAIKITATFSGTVLNCLFSAEKEMRSKKIDFDKYEVSILESSESITLILKEPGLPKDEMGNTGSIPGYEVEVRKQDHRVIRSNYIR